MAQLKRESNAVKRATVRAAKLKSIDKALDLGNGNTLEAYNTQIDAVKQANDDYNTLKATVDGKLDELETIEATLDSMSTNMLAGVRIKYGADSSEYEMAGGTRKSEYKKNKPKAVQPKS